MGVLKISNFEVMAPVTETPLRLFLDVYRFLKEAGSGFMQFIPIVERIAADPASG